MAVQQESWKTFTVFLAGPTNDAHHDVIEKLKAFGQTEVTSSQLCDYLLVFCPITSRVGTDIEEALSNLPYNKPVILVVMHHTFNPQHVVANSRRHVEDPNVRLTVDCLFYQDRLLNCSLNETMWQDIQEVFGVPVSQNSLGQYLKNRLKEPLVQILIGVGVVVAIVIIVTVSVVVETKKER